MELIIRKERTPNSSIEFVIVLAAWLFSFGGVTYGQPKAQLYLQTGHSDTVNSVAYSPDGRTIVSASADKTVKLWEAASGQELRTLEGHTGPVNSAVFSSDGRLIASASWDKTIKLWDAASGRLLRTYEGHTDGVRAVAFSPDGQILASTSNDDTVRLWNTETAQQLRTFNLPTYSFSSSIVFSGDGKMLAWLGTGVVKVWNVMSNTEPRTLTGHVPTLGLNFVAFSPDGQVLASASNDHTVKLWNPTSGKETRTLRGHTAYVWSLSFSPDGTTLATASWDNSIKLWSVLTGQEMRTIRTAPVNSMAYPHSIAFSPDGKTLVTGGSDRTLTLWDVASGERVRVFERHTWPITSVAFSPDSKILAVASYDATIKLWDFTSGQLARTLSGHEYDATALVFSPDGKILASASRDNTIKLWDVTTGRDLHTLGGDGSVNAVAFAPNGKILAGSGMLEYTGIIRLWNPASGTLLRTLTLKTEGINSVAFSPDGRTLAVGCADRTIMLWSLASGTLLRTLQGHAVPPGHTWSVLSLAFSSDGRTLASASDDNTIELWNVLGRRKLRSFRTDDPNTRRTVFALVPGLFRNDNFEPISPDDRFQIKEGVNGGLRFTEAETGTLLANLIAFDKVDWAVVTPDYLFDGSPGALKFFRWQRDNQEMETAAAEKLSKESNRPGLLAGIFEQATNQFAVKKQDVVTTVGLAASKDTRIKQPQPRMSSRTPAAAPLTTSNEIRQVDFRNFEYQSSTCYLLRAFGAPSSPVRNGKLDTESFTFSVDRITYGDLNGDGRDDAFVWVSIDNKVAANPENEYMGEILVYTTRGSGVTALTEIDPFQLYRDYENYLHPNDKCDRGEFLRVRMGQPHGRQLLLTLTSGSRFCPDVSYRVTMTYRWMGDKLALVGKPIRRILRSAPNRR